MFFAPFLLAFAAQAGPFNQAAVWRPPQDFRTGVIAACSNTGPKFNDCFAARMKAAGASPQALAFAAQVSDDGYMQAFREVGPVSIASVSYPFRANENDALLLVNGKPPTIDVDSFDILPQNELKQDGAYRTLSQQHADATLFPGDRSSPDNLLAISLGGKSLEFIAPYRVQQGCHACAVLGQAFFAFRFDEAANFEGAHLAGFTPQYEFSNTQSEAIAEVQAGSDFSVLLPSNRTTGYSWKVAAPSNSAVLKLLNQTYESPEKALIGAGGVEGCTFHAGSPGESTVVLSYVPPGRGLTPPGKQIHLTIHVR